MVQDISKYARYGLTAAWVIAGVGLAGATAGEVRRAWYVVPRPPEVIQDVTVRNVKDDEGRAATSASCCSATNSAGASTRSTPVEAGGKRPEFTPEMKAVLNSAVEIIAVGASSEEIPPGISFPEGRAKEERRAGRRADQIAVWIREALNRPIPVRKLNVGHHLPTGTDETSDQRRVVIILVLDQDEDTNIDQSLRSAMASQAVRAPIFEALLTKYSLGGGDHFAWVP